MVILINIKTQGLLSLILSKYPIWMSLLANVLSVLEQKNCLPANKQAATCIPLLMYSRSVRTSARVFVPSMFLNVVWARSRVAPSAFSTFAMDIVASWTLQQTTASTAMVTLSLVRILKSTPRYYLHMFCRQFCRQFIF